MTYFVSSNELERKTAEAFRAGFQAGKFVAKPAPNVEFLRPRGVYPKLAAVPDLLIQAATSGDHTPLDAA